MTLKRHSRRRFKSLSSLPNYKKLPVSPPVSGGIFCPLLPFRRYAARRKEGCITTPIHFGVPLCVPPPVIPNEVSGFQKGKARFLVAALLEMTGKNMRIRNDRKRKARTQPAPSFLSCAARRKDGHTQCGITSPPSRLRLDSSPSKGAPRKASVPLPSS